MFTIFAHDSENIMNIILTIIKVIVNTNDKCSAVAEMGDRLATIDMGRKVRGCVPVVSLPLNPSCRLATIHGPKSGGRGAAVPLL